MKTVLKSLGIIILIVILLVAFLIWRFDPEALGATVINRLNQNEGIDITAESFALSPLKGLELQSAQATLAQESGTLNLEIDRLLLEHEIWPLLQGRFEVHQIVLEAPQIELVSVPAPPDGESEATPAGGGGGKGEGDGATSGTVEETDSGGLVVDVQSLRIVDGRLVLRTEGSDQAGMEIVDLDVDFNDIVLDPSGSTPLEQIKASGTLSAAEIRTEGVTATDARGGISIGDSKIALSDLGLATPNAQLSLPSFEADFAAAPFTYKLEVAGSVDVNSMMNATGDGFGPASLALQGSGAGPDPNDFVADGTLRLDSGTIPSSPWLAIVEKLLGAAFINGAAYQGTDIGLSVAEGRLDIAPFELTSESFKLGSVGWVDMQGPISLRLEVFAPRELMSIGGVTGDVLNALTDENGWLTVSFDIGGTFDEPDVDLDWTVFEEAAKSGLKKGIKKGIGGLLKKD
ncbi:MAG: hypothetical protein GWP16_02295 [Nitrospirae bacterium]|nr:hypothetical protein [Nitrospirota bacterium]